jgi:hypothetical protein
MSIQSARELLRDYCKSSNFLFLMEGLAAERSISLSDIQSLVDAGEYIIEPGLNLEVIKRNPDFKPNVSKKIGVDRNELLAAIDAAQVFSNELNQPIKDLKWQSVKCPFHEDSEPSLRILLPDGGFNCLGCGESGGTVIDLVMKLHNLDFPTAINHLAANYTTIRQ